MHTYADTQASSTPTTLHATRLTAQTEAARLLPQVAQSSTVTLVWSPGTILDPGWFFNFPRQPVSTLGSTQALQVTRVTLQEMRCFYRLGSKHLDLPGAHKFRSTDIPACRGDSRSKGTAELQEFKLGRFWHSEGTGMEMNPIL